MSVPTGTLAQVLAVMATERPWRDGEPLPKASTIRQWRQRGILTDHGRDRRGRARYDLIEVMDAARRHEASTS